MIIAANFKTNHTRKSTAKYLEKLVSYVKENSVSEDIYIFPPFTAFDDFELCENITLGAQNAYPAEKGSFTGEIGLEQLEEFDIKTVLIGHSERRHILGENQGFIAEKFNFFKDRGFKIVYCVGEPLEIRREGEDALQEYIKLQFSGIDTKYEKLIVAYEPVWAIGTGLSAEPVQIEETISFISNLTKAPILYGGSVKPSNIKEIVSIAGCGGALIGTASWDVDSFIEMITIVEQCQ
ncbi:triose-phosphate isomerase [Nitrosophilus alvini]|uniref:triose-phosphate isomerase n=1 Tax=Nitrosophilus alvini TaxID=2714855 RepID=UPI00190C2934|nr:triose-phosphate isomerase [Nitrosophilus alvini]